MGAPGCPDLPALGMSAPKQRMVFTHKFSSIFILLGEDPEIGDAAFFGDNDLGDIIFLEYIYNKIIFITFTNNNKIIYNS